MASHDRSLSLPSVQSAIPRAIAIVSSSKQDRRHDSGLESWAASDVALLVSAWVPEYIPAPADINRKILLRKFYKLLTLQGHRHSPDVI